MEKLKLSSHYTYKNILRQCLAPILMMIFTSLYVVVDGIFISQIAGEEAFEGINIIAPITMIVGGLGFMFGSGGAALTSKFLGEKKEKEANKTFTMMIEASFFVVLLLSVILFFFIEKIAIGLASLSPDSTEEMIKDATLYGKIMILGSPIFAVQSIFHSFFIVNETPKLGFAEILLAGITNIIMDAILIAGPERLGVVGAAIGTICGYVAGAAFSLIYFLRAKNTLLKVVPCWPDVRILFKSSTNGLSDFIFNISSSIVGLVFNIQLLHYLGKDGVNAYGVILYFSFVFVAIFIGFSMGMGPIIGFNFGAQNHKELKNVIDKLLVINLTIGLVIVGLSEALAEPLARMFISDPVSIALSTKALRIYSICYLFSGFGIMFTGMFTSLNNGLVSGLISFLRSLAFQLLFVFLLPLTPMKSDGIWWSIVISEALSFAVAITFYFGLKKRYHY